MADTAQSCRHQKPVVSESCGRVGLWLMREQCGAPGLDLLLQYGDAWPRLGFPFMKGNSSSSFINCE